MIPGRAVLAGALAVLGLMVLAGCNSESSAAPAPLDKAGLSVVAEARGQQYLVHTKSGDIDFVTGVNVPDSAPGSQPGELAFTNEQYLEWFDELAAMGIRNLRVYGIEMPHFYQQLERHNRRNPANPLYLTLGVYVPDAEELARGQNLYDPTITANFQQEIRDAVAAAHGDLTREQQPGRAYGRWTADVSQWVIGWMPGIEFDGATVQHTDEVNTEAPATTGTYFTSTADASPSERWLAARMDELASAEASYGSSVPVGFINWPTADPLRHPDEPQEIEDLAGLDANHIQPTSAWPGGTYAVYDAYPYYPDFLRHEPRLQEFQYNGKADPYAGYLADLLAHHASMPVLLGEFGVPSSIGSAHLGPLGRGQGDHSEQEASAMNAELIQMQRDLGLAGGFLFSWQDEWYKRTWNTERRHVPEARRSLWHDPWTNEQYFGLWATESKELGSATLAADSGQVGKLAASWDHAWVDLSLQLPGGFVSPVRLGFDVVEGGPSSGHLPGSAASDTSSDYALVLEPGGQGGTASAQLWSRAELDATLLDYAFTADERPATDGWVRQQLTLNFRLVVPTTGEALPAEFQEVGTLRQGSWDPNDEGFDSRNTWRVDGDTISVRLPWMALGISDPSSKQALTIGPPEAAGKPHVAGSVPVDAIAIVVESGDERVEAEGLDWGAWDAVSPDGWSRRLKVGSEQVTDLMAQLSKPS